MRASGRLGVKPRAPSAPRPLVRLAAGASNGVSSATHLPNGLDVPVELRNGRVVEGPDLSVTVNGIRFPNPFVIGSGGWVGGCAWSGAQLGSSPISPSRLPTQARLAPTVSGST